MAVRGKEEMGSGLNVESDPAKANHHGAHDEEADQEKDQHVDLSAEDVFHDVK